VKKSFVERYKVMAPRIIKALNQRNFEAYFCETSEKAVECAAVLNSSRSIGGMGRFHDS